MKNQETRILLPLLVGPFGYIQYNVFYFVVAFLATIPVYSSIVQLLYRLYLYIFEDTIVQGAYCQGLETKGTDFYGYIIILIPIISLVIILSLFIANLLLTLYCLRIKNINEKITNQPKQKAVLLFIGVFLSFVEMLIMFMIIYTIPNHYFYIILSQYYVSFYNELISSPVWTIAIVSIWLVLFLLFRYSPKWIIFNSK